MSAFAFALFILSQDVFGIAIRLIIVFVLTVASVKNKKYLRLSNNKVTHKSLVISLVILIISFISFISRWPNSERAINIANNIGIDVLALVLVIGLILFPLSFPFVYNNVDLICRLAIRNDNNCPKKTDCKVNRYELLFILICSVLIITVCSKSSFLYPINDWVDSNVYFTIGKSILDGKVIYRDLFDQKGPLIYFIHTVASLISYKSFIGMYFIEILACFFFLLYSYKTIRLYLNKESLFLIPIFGLFIYTAAAFSQGDSAEELCLPFIAYAIFVSTKAIKNNNNLTKKECFLIGLFSACVFWTKFTLVGCFVGVIIVPSIIEIKNKRINNLFHAYLYIFVGVMIATIPYIVYFGLNNAIKDLFGVYFYDNLFVYTSDIGDSFLIKMIHGLRKGYINIRTYNEVNGIIMIIGFVWATFTKGSKEYAHILLTSSMSYFLRTLVVEAWHTIL